MSNKECKERYFKKVYENAEMIECACGCGHTLKSKDHYGRDQKFINGHNGRKYEDPTQYKREWNHRNRKARNDYKLKYGRKRKINAIKLKGGKCFSCGLEYNGTNGSLFDFHHIDPSKKKFNVGATKLTALSWKKILLELDKCNLLCSNCHRIFHTGGW